MGIQFKITGIPITADLIYRYLASNTHNRAELREWMNKKRRNRPAAATWESKSRIYTKDEKGVVTWKSKPSKKQKDDQDSNNNP